MLFDSLIFFLLFFLKFLDGGFVSISSNCLIKLSKSSSNFFSLRSIFEGHFETLFFKLDLPESFVGLV